MSIKNIIITIIAVIGVGFLIYRFSSSNEIKVKKIDVSNGKVVRSISSSGFVKSNVEAELGFPISGKITNVYFEEGDTVKAGDLIAQVYSEDLYYAAESRRKDYDAAVKTKSIYIEDYETNQDAVGGMDEYRLNLRKLEIQAESAENTYKNALSNLRKTYMYAPFSGTIINSNLKVGNVVSLGDIVKIADLDTLEFQAELDQEDYTELKVDQDVEIVLDAYPNKVFSGKVLQRPMFVNEDSSTKTFKVKVSILDPEKLVVKGMTGDANILTSVKENVRYLPFDSIFNEDGKNFVWIEENGKAVKRFIEVGLEGDTFTEITSELPDFVIIPDSNSAQITDGVSVSY